MNKLIHGDALEKMRLMTSESVNLIITSPPYFNQREYGSGEREIGLESSFEAYIDALVEIVTECERIILSDGNIVLNIGDKRVDGSLSLLPYRVALAIQERTDLRLINQITWIKTNPPPKIGNRLTDATEPFFHFARDGKHYRDDQGWQPHLNHAHRQRRNKKLGEGYFTQIEKSSLTDEQKSLARSKLVEAIQAVNSGEWTEFRMKIKGIHAEPYGGQSGGRQNQIDRDGFTIIPMYGNDLKMNYIQWATENDPSITHPAPYPTGLIREFIRYLCPKNGLVLDPMIGSGSTAVAALMEGRRYVGVDLNEKFLEEAERRIENVRSVVWLT